MSNPLLGSKDVEIVRWAAFSCLHCPFQDPVAISKLVHTLEEFRPNCVVLLGDLFEAASASVHRPEEVGDLRDEYRVAAGILEELRGAVGAKARLVWCLGNHDDNLQVKDVRRIPKHLRSLVHWNTSEWKSEFLRWEQLPYIKDRTGCFELGQVIFYHGFMAGVNAGELEGIQMANNCGGHAHRLMVSGHTHRPVPVTQIMFTQTTPLPFWYANAGTLGPIKPDYMLRKNSAGWGPAVVLGEAVLGRPSRMRQGPQWSAETVMLGA